MIDYVPLQALLQQLRQCGYRHTTVSPATHQIINSRIGNEFARNIVDVLGWSRPISIPAMSENSLAEQPVDATLFALMQQANILQPEAGLLHSSIRVSAIEDQLFVHSAYPTRQTDAVFFGPDTYRFIHALNHFFLENKTPINRAVDICTGCGPAAITLARLFPQAEVYGVDINDAALELAAFNAQVNQVNNARFVNSNLLQDVDGDFDFITANPPYLVDASQRAYRHGGGLYGYQLSLDIIDHALPRLSAGGTLLLYTGVVIVNGKDLFFEEVLARLANTTLSYSYEEVDPDIFAEELLAAPYLEADRIAAVVLKIHKPLDAGENA